MYYTALIIIVCILIIAYYDKWLVAGVVCVGLAYLASQHKVETIKSGGAIMSKDVIKQLLIAIKSMLHIGSASTAAVATLGLGGDMIVDILFLLFSAAEMMARLTAVLVGSLQQIIEISKLGFATGPAGVKDATMKILSLVPADTLESLCGNVRASLSIVVEIATAVIGTFIPDDMGTITVAGTYFMNIAGIVVGSPAWYEAIVAFYELIPQNLRKYVQEPEELRLLLIKILTFIQETVFAANISTRRKIAQLMAGAVASGYAASTAIMMPLFIPASLTASAGIQTANIAFATETGREYARDAIEAMKPHVDICVNLVHISLPLLFGSAVCLQQCYSH